jgi:hypothetical protein
MSNTPSAASGRIITVDFPFVLSTYREPYWGPDDVNPEPVKCWKPGIEWEPAGPGDCVAVARGMGKMVLTEVSRHKPSKYPERVFYTRRWIDPDGKVFGKPKLRITTASAFARMCNGYRQPFQVVSGRA